MPERVGRYTLHEILGTGGMATVHLGAVKNDEGVNEVVAIKRLHPNHARDATFVTMFLDEVRVGKLVRHPNVVRVLDCVYDGDQLFAVMDYVHGETLARLKTGVPVPLPIAIAIVRDVLDALAAAHDAKDAEGNALELVHRDVTPENVLVDTDGLARLTDFGVAKAAGRLQSTQGGGVRGKFAYAAPEQVGGDVTRATDIYAVGLVLWELLVGRRAIEGSTDAELVMRALDPKIEAPSKLVSEIPSALDDVVLKALAKEERDRYASASAFREALVAAAPAAARSEIAAWVKERAGEKLDEREARMTELLASEPPPERTTGAVTLEPPKFARRPVLPIALGAAILAGSIAAYLGTRPSREPSPPVTVPDTGVIPYVPPPSVSIATSATAPAASASEAPSASVVVKPRLIPKPSAAPCDPPWLIDSNGVRRYNRDCLK